ncbi:MAG: hypothetical protein RLZZ383_1060 [Pseudomonadota bacterium]|jgi:hypothetical protein
MSRDEVWLQLAPEFGGTRFGPIVGTEFRLGTAEDNHVRLAEGLGVEPHHVRLIRRSGDAFLVAPVERSATVWAQRRGTRQPSPIQSPIVLAPGDAFLLGSAQGVRFTLVSAPSPKPKRGGSGPTGAGPTTGSEMAQRMKAGVASEVFRRVRGAIYTTWLGRSVQRAMTFIRGRQFLSPVYIVGFGLMLSGWLFGWRSNGTLKGLQTDLASTQKTVADRDAELADCRAGNEGAGKLDLFDLTSRILRDNAWRDSLDWPELRTAMSAEVKEVFARGADPRGRARMEAWYLGRGNPWSGASSRLTEAGLPPALAGLLAWSTVDLTAEFEALREADKAAAELTEVEGDAWRTLASPNPAQRACQRGPFRLSFRQADALGVAVPPDAYFSLQDSAAFTLGGGTEAFAPRILERLQATVLGAGKPAMDFSQFRIASETMVQVQLPDATCLAAKEPEDERTRGALVAKKLADRLGAKAQGLPAEGRANWLSGRLAMLFALDLEARRWGEVDLSKPDLASAFASVRDKDAEGYRLVANRTGQALGRALAVPCVILLDRSAADVPTEMGSPPTFEDCALLKVKAEYDKL